MSGTIWCLGRSYSAHAKELGNDIPKEPLIFIKSGACAESAADTILLPNEHDEVHHEVEMVLRLGDDLYPESYCVGIDLTNRTQQTALKAKGQPWALAKSFTGSAPLGPMLPVEDIDLDDLSVRLKKNSELVQSANTSQLLFKVDEIMDYLQKHFPVQPGDLVMTGTPDGVGPLKDGDVIEARVGESSRRWIVKV